MLEYDIADILEERDPGVFSKMMQEAFEERAGTNRFFRITGTPANLGQVSADLEQPALQKLLEKPPNPHGRSGGWDVRPMPPLKRTALGFENQRVEFHHMKFVKNGHLEFWTAIDQYFCWQQDPDEMRIHPRLYPYPVVEHPLSFLRLYRALADFLHIHGDILLQMQYLNVKGAILLPYQPESIAFMHPFEPVRPLKENRLVFEKKRVPEDFDPDPSALEIIKELYYAFGYGREHIPFFDATGHSTL
jgi:hypothetical protein